MRRARHPLPFEMWGIKTDPNTNLYFLSEYGITYYMTLEHTRLLKAYYRGSTSGKATLAEWYKELDMFTRKEVIVVGREEEESDFYPDESYE